MLLSLYIQISNKFDSSVDLLKIQKKNKKKKLIIIKITQQDESVLKVNLSLRLCVCRRLGWGEGGGAETAGGKRERVNFVEIKNSHDQSIKITRKKIF